MVEYPWKLTNSSMTKVACVDAYAMVICCLILIQHEKIYFNPEEKARLDV
jgi:hypothetical protein